MSSVTIRRIEELTDKETDDIVAMLVRGYHDNPAIPAMTGGKDELKDLLFRAMVRAGGLAGQLYVLENDRHEVLSMALWYPPGTGMFNTEEERSLGYNELMSKLDEETLDWWKNSYGGLTGEFIKTWLPKSPNDCWWLNILGTDPDHQRKGYATSLLNVNDGLIKIPSPNVIGFCSTSEENAEFYANAGFPTRKRMEMPTRYGSFPVFGHSRDV